jgi:transcriptional repressor NrdR
LIEKTVDKIMEELEQKYGREIPTTAIGEKIMDSLKKMDDVAYVRFASVYRQFRDARDFVSEVKNLGAR